MNNINQSTLGHITLFSTVSANNKLSLWQKKDPTEKAVPKTKPQNMPSTGKVSFDAKAELSKIEAASTIDGVSKIITSLNSKMNLMKKANASAELMLSIKTVIKKAVIKLTALKDEEKQAKKAKAAKQKQELEESQKLTEDLRIRRLNRKQREIEDVKNSDVLESGEAGGDTGATSDIAALTALDASLSTVMTNPDVAAAAAAATTEGVDIST